MLDNARLIMYHKQATSARTLFLRLGGTVCNPDGFPTLAQLMDGDAPPDSREAALHPASVVAEVEQQLGLSRGSLEVEGEFHARVDVPDAVVNVFLARFTSVDPPHAWAGEHEAKFIPLTEARNLPQVELELLRQAYAVIMEG